MQDVPASALNSLTPHTRSGHGLPSLSCLPGMVTMKYRGKAQFALVAYASVSEWYGRWKDDRIKY